MLFRDIVMLAATQNGIAPAGGGPTELWAFPEDAPAEADWTFTGGWSWSAGEIVVFESTAGETAELAGAAKTAFDAAVSNSTACTVTLTFSVGNFLTGTISVAMKGGASVDFVGDGGTAEIANTVTSGAGSGFVMAGSDDFPLGQISGISVAVA